MERVKKTGWCVFLSGLIIPYVLFTIRRSPSLYDYWGSDFLFGISLPAMIVSQTMIQLKREQLKLDWFGKLLFSFLVSVWFTVSILIVLR